MFWSSLLVYFFALPLLLLAGPPHPEPDLECCVLSGCTLLTRRRRPLSGSLWHVLIMAQLVLQLIKTTNLPEIIILFKSVFSASGGHSQRL